MAEERRPFGHAFQRPDAPGWYVRVRRGAREIVRYAGPSRRHADRYLDRLQDEWFMARATGKPPPMLSRETFATFANAYERILEARLSPAALALARGHLALAGTRLSGPLTTVNTAAIGDFLVWLRAKREAAPGTVNRYLSTLSGMFREAKSRGLVVDNPCSGVRRLPVQETPPPYLSHADCRALEAHAPASRRPLLILASETGLRLGELERLQWRDLDLGRGTVTVRESKTRRVRHVPLPVRALAAARNLPRGAVKLRGEDPVFPGLRRERRALSRAFPGWAKDAGLQRLTFHALRHGWASRLAESGADDAALMELGGWTSPLMVKRYAHHRPAGASREAVERMDRARRGTGRGTERRKRA